MTYKNPVRRWSRAFVLIGASLIGICTCWTTPVAAAPAGEDDTLPPEVRDAVDKSLIWLAKVQKPDGTFPQGDVGGSTAVSSLVAMAFLARGHVPGHGNYGETLERSIDFIIRNQQETGLLSQHTAGNAVFYEHAISTVMLAQCYGVVDQGRREKIGKALAKEPCNFNSAV